ncbi:hemerythrin domain-containing protein [Simplicispira suum]|uniref:Hemerythrin-like domain-containing protein n=1 Tax=Simplicispira suum TaxID=2109915 RepID=A0A2S0N443_9BURK|nr:hemerythrin domain-containing protein [Simplicispira suum]AVO42886.1 hypothetical protein C6571_17700 [Simplicispira suum]
MVSGIQHHSTLVTQLVGDHRQLLESFGVLKKTAEANDATGFKRELQGFKALLIPHLLEEAVRLYTFLRQEFKTRGDAGSYQLVNDYKSEMKGIGDAAVHFVDTYSATAEDAIDFQEARASLHEIGRLLGDRIRREETELYPLYQSLH